MYVIHDISLSNVHLHNIYTHSMDIYKYNRFRIMDAVSLSKWQFSLKCIRLVGLPSNMSKSSCWSWPVHPDWGNCVTNRSQFQARPWIWKYTANIFLTGLVPQFAIDSSLCFADCVYTFICVVQYIFVFVLYMLCTCFIQLVYDLYMMLMGYTWSMYRAYIWYICGIYVVYMGYI